MLNLTTNKIISIVGGVAGVSATGAGIIYLTSDSNKSEENAPSQKIQEPTENKVTTKSIITLLGEKDSGKEMLSKDGSADNVAWKANWVKFKTKYKTAQETNDAWKFEGLEVALAGAEAVQGFKDKCDTNSKAEVENEKMALYSEVKDFCTKDKQPVGG